MPTIREYLDDMRKQGKTPHFTNVPGEATADSFSYDEGEFTAETERQLETPGTGFDYTPEPTPTPEGASPKTPAEKIPEKPPDSALHPEGQRDFKDRQKYSDFVIAKMGFDPFKLNTDEEIEKAQETLPDVFEAAFGGQVLYNDIDKLDKDEKKHWDTVHRGFNVHVKNSVKEKIARGKEEYKARMKVFEDKQAEKKAMPKALEASLKSIFVSDQDGKKVGKIPAGVLAKANKDAEQLINTGEMTGVEVVAKITDDLVRERMQIAAIDEALAEIPDMEKEWLGFGSDAKGVENVKSIITGAMEQGAEHKDIVSTLKDRGWDSKNIAKVLPKKTDKIETPGEPGGTQQYKTPEGIRDAFRSGEITRDQAKQYLSQAT